MRSITILGLLLFAVTAYASAPPPPPPIFGGVTGAPLVLASSAEDSIIFEGSSIVTYGLARTAQISTAASAAKYELEGGGQLVVDGATAAGTYVLANRGSVTVGQMTGYPRYYTLVPSQERAIFFRAHTTARIAVLVDPAESGPKTLAEAQNALVQRMPGAIRYPSVVQSEHAAFEYPSDWYRRANVELGTELTGHVLLTFIAFGQALPTSDLLPAIRKQGSRVTYQAAFSRPTIRPTRLDPDVVRQSGRLIGKADVDLGTGQITLVGE